MRIPSCRSIFSAAAPLTLLPLAIALSGCGMRGGVSSTGSTLSPTQPAVVYEGRAYGGEQPIVGATLQLYAAGAPASGGNYGQGASALIPAANQPVTDSNGSFSVTNLYTCPATPAVSQIYIVATGGSSGPGNPVNPNIALMAALGSCSAGKTLSPSLNIWIDEVTTVATVYALQQFMAAPAAANVNAPSIGAPGNTYNGVQSAVIGLQNAFSMVNNLVNISTGSAAIPTNSWATPDNAGQSINTIADILAACVNSNPSTSSECGTIFGYASPSGSFTAADTIQAAWYIAQNPTRNVSTLYKQISPVPPYPDVSATPNDFTLAVNLAPQYTSGTSTLYALNVPSHIAFDAYGNAWLSNNGSISNSVAAAAGVVELAPNGSVLMSPVKTFTASTTGGAYSQFTTKPSSNSITYSKPKMVAVDTNNNVWVSNYGGSTGTPAAGTIGYVSGSTGVGVAGGATLSGYYVGAAPWGLAIDGHNNVYEANSGTSGLDPLSIGKLVASTGSYTYSTSGSTAQPYAIPNLTIPSGNNGSSLVFSSVLAVDANTAASGGADGILWSVNNSCMTMSTLYDSTAVVPWGVISMFDADTLSPLSGSEAVTNYSGATTGAGSTTNCGNSTESGAGLQINQIFSAATANPFGIAIDKSNGVWIGDNYYASSGAYNAPGFNGLTYLSAPTTSTGTIPSSTAIDPGSSFTASASGNQGQIIREPTYMEVDGNNNLWVASQSFAAVASASINTSGTTPVITFLTPSVTGWEHTFATAYGLAIDLSGNVWVTNTSSSATYTGQAGGPTTPYTGASVTVMIGAAAPVITPLAERIAANMLGQKP